jgi:hypothetical protein
MNHINETIFFNLPNLYKYFYLKLGYFFKYAHIKFDLVNNSSSALKLLL